MTLKFINPLPRPLNNIIVTLEGAGLGAPVEIKLK